MLLAQVSPAICTCISSHLLGARGSSSPLFLLHCQWFSLFCVIFINISSYCYFHLKPSHTWPTPLFSYHSVSSLKQNSLKVASISTVSNFFLPNLFWTHFSQIFARITSTNLSLWMLLVICILLNPTFSFQSPSAFEEHLTITFCSLKSYIIHSASKIPCFSGFPCTSLVSPSQCPLLGPPQFLHLWMLVCNWVTEIASGVMSLTIHLWGDHFCWIPDMYLTTYSTYSCLDVQGYLKLMSKSKTFVFPLVSLVTSLPHFSSKQLYSSKLVVLKFHVSFFHNPYSEHQKILWRLTSKYIPSVNTFHHFASSTLDQAWSLFWIVAVAFPKSLFCPESGFCVFF